MNIWENYYDKESNRRRFPDEDCVRFLSYVAGQNSIAEKSNILDIGCGDGRHGQAVKTWFPDSHLIGIDPYAYIESIVDAKYYDTGANVSFSQWVSGENRLDDIYTSIGEWEHGRNYFKEYSIILDCMTSQHFPWSEHEAYFRLVYENLETHGFLFLKHLDKGCSDHTLTESIDEKKVTYRNIPNVPAACYPDNGLVCMPSGSNLERCLLEVGFFIDKVYQVKRVEQVGKGDWCDKIFAHSIFFCRKPL